MPVSLVTHSASERRPAELIRKACRLEVLARKPGNVHPQASFADLTCDDLLQSADLIAPELAASTGTGLGDAILRAVSRTQTTLGRNTNLGIVLLLAPLAAVPWEVRLEDGIRDVLRRTTVEDARRTYRAIRLANPGGMGQAPEQDLAMEPTRPLTDLMRLAADRDHIARQYAVDFADLFAVAVPALLKWSGDAGDWERDVIGLHLSLMAAFPDTLIARKCGTATAAESARRAQAVLDAGWPGSDAGRAALGSLDAWLRGAGHARNPGTTADFVAATLFAALRDYNWKARGEVASPMEQ